MSGERDTGRDEPTGATTATPATEASVTHETAGATFTVRARTAILDAALAQGVELDHGCRVGVCGACAVEVVEGAENLVAPDPIETDTLTRHGAEPSVRLACRACVHGPVKLRSA